MLPTSMTLKKSDNLRERKVRTQLQFVRRFVIGLIIFLTLCIIFLSFDNLRKLGAGLAHGGGHRWHYHWLCRTTVACQFSGGFPDCFYPTAAVRRCGGGRRRIGTGGRNNAYLCGDRDLGRATVGIAHQLFH